MKLRFLVLEDEKEPNPSNICIAISADIVLSKDGWDVFDDDFNATGIWGHGDDKISAIIDYLDKRFEGRKHE